MSVFDSCGDGCGWTAGIIGALAYGSFGVPIKETKDIDVHPLVLQSYKTAVMFATCWGVVFLGVDIAFTKWGLISGMMWVLGGTGGIYGIRMAGLAIAVGIWASIMIIVNFIFGILIFQEPVYDIWGTMGSFFLLILGLVGMSHYSAPKPKAQIESLGTVDENDRLGRPLTENADYEALELPVRKRGRDNETAAEEEMPTDESVRGVFDNKDHEPHVSLFSGRLQLTKRQCGILGAAWNGVFTGGSLIPLHYAKLEGFGGARYMISMSCGAFISNIFVWVVFIGFEMMSSSNYSMEGALQAMPSWHFKKLYLPGFMAGILLSIAMFSSILAITYLGQGVGNSLIQTKILVSGLWGIFWYKEITGTTTVIKWFIAASMTVIAIIWLSLERILASGGGGH